MRYKPEIAEAVLVLLEEMADDEADAAVHAMAVVAALVNDPAKAHEGLDVIYAAHAAGRG